MTTLVNRERTLTELDHARLERLLRDEAGTARTAPLEHVLDHALLVSGDGIAADIVTMNSEVLLETEGAPEPRRIVIRYPAEADAATGGVSVLSPAGAGILGTRVGDVVSWAGADGRSQVHRVKDLIYQPERSGDKLR